MNIAQTERELYALEIARILATDYYGDAERVGRGVRLYTSDMVDVANRVVMSEGGWGVYHVSSQTCQCPDFRRRGEACKHVIALCLAKCVKKLMKYQYNADIGGCWVLCTIVKDKTTGAERYFCQTEICPESRQIPKTLINLGIRLDDAWEYDMAHADFYSTNGKKIIAKRR